METVTTPPPGDATAINILYVPTAPSTLQYSAGEHFLSIQDRIQVHGLPTALQAGTPTQAGTCQVWTETSADGLRTLAFAHDAISVLMTSDSLSAADLVSYVAHDVCR